MTRRILILMSDTGGGHRASAQALQAGFQRLYGDQYQIDIIDLLMKHLPWPLRELPKSYPFLSNTVPWLWSMLYRTEGAPGLYEGLVDGMARLSSGSVRKALEQYRPDLIISVHPLVHEVTFRALDELGWRTPVVTVVTDLATAYPTWFHPRVERCFVASDEAAQRAAERGLRPDQVRQYGLPIRPAFGDPPRPRGELRAELGMAAHLPAALLLGGGEGIGPVGKIAASLNRRLSGSGTPAGQIVVVCGRNRKLQDELEQMAWRVPVRINGFVDNMHEWMVASDCVVTKAGPGTIAEALICGLPIVLSGFIPGQEAGNVAYVVDHNVGLFCAEPEGIADIVCEWFMQPAKLAGMAANASKLGHAHATAEIVKEIAGLLD